MLFGKKRYAKKFGKGNDFLKSYSVKISALMNLTDKNENVTDKLNHLKETFVFSISPPQNKEVVKCQESIEAKFDDLKAILEQEDWYENDVIRRISIIEMEVGMLTSIRV